VQARVEVVAERPAQAEDAALTLDSVPSSQRWPAVHNSLPSAGWSIRALMTGASGGSGRAV
jgi:hypothetical protein